MKYPFENVIFLIGALFIIVWALYNGVYKPQIDSMYMDSVPNTVENLG